MFSEKLNEEQIREIMNVISDDGAVRIISIRTYNNSFEDSLDISDVPEIKVEFQETTEIYQLFDYHIKGFNRAGAGSDYIYRKMMYGWFGKEYVVKYLMEN